MDIRTDRGGKARAMTIHDSTGAGEDSRGAGDRDRGQGGSGDRSETSKDYRDYEMSVLTSDLITLNHHNESVNDQIIYLLKPVFLPFHRSDVNQNNDFYVLMRDKIENAVNEALAAIDYHRYNGKESRLIHSLFS
ncbi:unnamed protein product [Adineta steineri]|uniref:Uncharacterized protein n=1 Tax=Adineta steineri TaxID=433720 RepID=A0A815FBU6_9BILA|nr:unnamed protein product [Adineta steineri]